MNVEIITLYAIVSNSDITEGKGRRVVVGYARTGEEGAALAAGKGVMGSDAAVEGVQAVQLPDGEVRLLGKRVDQDWSREAALAAARAKLTPEELKLLKLV